MKENLQQTPKKPAGMVVYMIDELMHDGPDGAHIYEIRKQSGNLNG